MILALQFSKHFIFTHQTLKTDTKRFQKSKVPYLIVAVLTSQTWSIETLMLREHILRLAQDFFF